MTKVDLTKGAGSSANQDGFPFEPRGVQYQADGELIAPISPSTFLKTPREVADGLAASPLEQAQRRVRSTLTEKDEGKTSLLDRLKSFAGGARGR